jgi:hypothetical protein
MTHVPCGRTGMLAFLVAASLAATPAHAQKRVLLELRPKAGDTLRMVVEQQSEMTGSGSDGASHSVTTRMRMTTRAIVLAQSAKSTDLLSITDGVDISTTDPHGKPMVEQLIRQLEGRTLRMQLSPDGTARLLPAPAARDRRAGDVAELVAAMPAAFPSHPVAVGERWTRELAIPGTGGGTLRDGGVFRATFRLDSLSADGALAWISMRGEIGRSLGATRGQGEMRGTLTGMMLLDRVRGWLADSRTLVMVHTTLATAAGAEPMKFVTRITQRVTTAGRP